MQLTKEQIFDAKTLLRQSDFDRNNTEYILRLARILQTSPTTLALTDEQWSAIDSMRRLSAHGMITRGMINAGLSRHPAEPQPAAEPSPAPVDAPIDLMETVATLIRGYLNCANIHEEARTTAHEIIALVQAHPPAGWVSVDEVEKAVLAEGGQGNVKRVVARLSPAKPKERVTVAENETEWVVKVDRGQTTYFPKECYLKADRDKFAAVLRAELETRK